MGFSALLNTLLAIYVAAIVFTSMKMRFGLSVFQNLPGAFFAFASVFLFFGWLSQDMLDGYMGIPMLHIPWHTWLMYLSLAILWYLVVLLLSVWSKEKNEK